MKLYKICEAVRSEHPLIHAITNPISINQCANAILAVGGRPMMAEHPREVEKITETADALLLNLGNITDVRMESMQLSLKCASDKNIPVVLDVVGVACSKLRKDFAFELLDITVPTVIKGNYSEIRALYDDCYHAVGVDADTSLTMSDMDEVCIFLAKKWNTTILASGKADIVTDGKRIAHIYNGSEQLTTVTGTGCMLGALCAAYVSTGIGMDAVITACVVLGISGEAAQTHKGSGSFMAGLMDFLSTLSNETMETYIRMEVNDLEKI